MTAADPRDGLPERVLALLDKHGGWQATLDYIANLEALAHARPQAVDEAAALALFTEYFVTNYPGPQTIISDPNWHAPRIFRAAKYAMKASLAPERAP